MNVQIRGLQCAGRARRHPNASEQTPSLWGARPEAAPRRQQRHHESPKRARGERVGPISLTRLCTALSPLQLADTLKRW